MYLVKMEDMQQFVFLVDDPRLDGCTYPVVEGVSLEHVDGTSLDTEKDEQLANWRDGRDMPEHFLGQHADLPSRYRVFLYEQECNAAGFMRLGVNYCLVANWNEMKAAIK